MPVANSLETPRRNFSFFPPSKPSANFSWLLAFAILKTGESKVVKVFEQIVFNTLLVRIFPNAFEKEIRGRSDGAWNLFRALFLQIGHS
jgi:hypothetical protein